MPFPYPEEPEIQWFPKVWPTIQKAWKVFFGRKTRSGGPGAPPTGWTGSHRCSHCGQKLPRRYTLRGPR